MDDGKNTEEAENYGLAPSFVADFDNESLELVEEGVLTARQSYAIRFLLTSRSIAEAATASGISERTLHRWIHEDRTFQAALLAAQDGSLHALSARLTVAADDALGVLHDLATNETIAAGVRQRAAASLLDLQLKIHTQLSVQVKIELLEQLVN